MITRRAVSLMVSIALVTLELILRIHAGGVSTATGQSPPTPRPASATELVEINLELCCPGNNSYGSPSPYASGLELVNAKRQVVQRATSTPPTYVRVGFHVGNVAGDVSIPMTKTWTYQTWTGSRWTTWGKSVTRSVHVVNLWDQDHHFRFLLPARYLASGSSRYRVVVRLTIGPHTVRGAIIFHGPGRGAAQ